MTEKHRTLKDILRDIPSKKLEEPCCDKHLCQVANHISNWPYLTTFMRITRPEMIAIREAWPFNAEAQRIELLRRWREKHGQAATYQSLCTIFCEAKKVALAEMVRDIVSTNPGKLI